MAITTSAGDGVRVTTASMNETLGDQSQANGTDEIVVSDTFTNTNNGQVEGTIGYVDRLAVLRQGQSNEETRFITVDTAGTGTTRILTVHEPWTTAPSSSETIHVSYVIQDCATVTGLGLINKRNQDYTSTRKLRVGNSGGGGFGYFALLFGASLETVDNSSTTDPDVRVESDGRFDSGYLFGGTPVSGGEMFLTPAVNGELAFEGVSGCECNWYDTVMIAVARPAFNFLASTTSKVRMRKCVFKFSINDFRLGAQDTDLNNVSWESDDTGTTPRLQVRDWTSGNFVQNITLVNFNGLETVTSGDDPVLKNLRFINQSKLITINTAETWTIINMVDPSIIGTANQNDVSIAGTGELLLQIDLDVNVTDANNSGLTSKIYVITNNNRGASTDSLLHELTADSNGDATANVEIRRYIDNGGTALTLQTTNGHAIIVSEYGKLPIIRNVTVQNTDEANNILGQTESFTQLTDVYQVETTASNAITQGDTTQPIAIENQTNPATLLKFTGGSGTNPSIGDTIGNNVNGAEGVLVSLVQGDWTAGTLLLDTRNATAWATGAHTLDDGASAGNWTATFDTGYGVKSFTWLLDIQSNSGQQVYDWFNAKLDESTLDTTGINAMDQVLFWADGGTNALPVVGTLIGAQNKFKTVSETIANEGWMVYNSDDATNGRVSYTNWESFQSDDDSVFTPDATVTLSVHVERKDTGANIQGASVIILKSSDNSLISQGTTDSNGDYTDSFAYTSDTPVIIRSRKSTLPTPRYFAEESANTITVNGLTQTFLMREDTIVAQS